MNTGVFYSVIIVETALVSTKTIKGTHFLGFHRMFFYVYQLLRISVQNLHFRCSICNPGRDIDVL